MKVLKNAKFTGNIKINDTNTDIYFEAYDDGVLQKLDASKCSFRIKNDTGYLITISNVSTETDYITFKSNELKPLPVGTYYLELWVEDSTGTYIYPDESFCKLRINENVTAAQGTTIPTISLEEYENKLQGYVDNAVADGKTEIKDDFDKYVDSITDSTIATATKASQDAATAINTANSANAAAQNATNIANAAKSNADTALQNASTALDTANTVKSTVDNASQTASNAQAVANEAKSTADSALSNATNAQSIANGVQKFANDQLVSPNLVAYSGMFQDLKGWTAYDYGKIGGSVKLEKHSYFEHGLQNLIWVTSPVQYKEMSVISNRLMLEPNTDYVVQVTGFQTENASNHLYVLGSQSQTSNNDSWDTKLVSQVLTFNTEEAQTILNIKFNSGNCISAYFRMDAKKETTDSTAASVAFANVKIEKGTHSTLWIPSIYSLLNRIINLENT